MVIPPREKGPKGAGWPTRRYSDAELASIPLDANLGLLLGDASGGLVDIDLDCEEARALAPRLLPATEMRHGRPPVGETHRWYTTDAPPPKVVRYRDPTTKREEKACLVELRSGSDGHAQQTVIPPSIHPSGVQLVWTGSGEPAPVEIAALQTAVATIAAASLLARHWPDGARHDAALALAGMLLRGGWDEEDAQTFVAAVADAAGDEEIDDRVRAVGATAGRLERGEPATGGPGLSAALGEHGPKLVATLRKWLGLRSTDEARNIAFAAGADRPEIQVTTDEPAVIDAAILALARAPEVYTRGPAIVEIITDAPETRGVTRSGPLARIHRCPEARVRELIARGASWQGYDVRRGRWGAVHPPEWAVRGVMARGVWTALRPLLAVAEAATLRPDGSILDAPGYDAATGIYLAPGVEVAVPDRPTPADARRALAVLLEPITEFSVASEAGRSAWAAGVVTGAVRPAIDGPTPLTIIDASARGSGKTLMADAAAIITTGRTAARMVYVADDAEVRKRITALALVGDPLALLDNVVGELGCASLDAALTGTTWRDRILGASQMTAELPLRIVWWATGNGLVIGADLARRALLVRLEPMCERPEERTGWRYPRLLDHVRAHRVELLSAALTIPRAYVVAGRPEVRLTPMGSYEAWSDLVRSSLVWAGAPDPCATIAEIRAGDTRSEALRRMVEAWPAATGELVTVAALLSRAKPGSPWRDALVEWCPPRGSDPLPTPRSMANRLRGIRRRVVAGRYLDAGQRVREGYPWVLSQVCDP